MPRRVSIRELLLRLVLAVALPLAALQAWHLYGDYQESSRRAREQVFSLAQAAASQTATFLGQAHNVLNGLAARPAVRSLDAARCDPILHDFLGLAPRFSNIATMTMDGRVVCSAVPHDAPVRMDPEKLLHLIRASGRFSVGKVTPGTISGKWAVPVGVPLHDGQGRIVGAVGLALDLLKFPMPSMVGLSASAAVGLVAGDGTILAHSLHAARFVGTKAGAGRTPLSERSGTAEEPGLDGIPRVRGFTPVPGTDWIAVASLPASEVYARVKARVAASILIAIAIVSLALLLAWRSGRKIGGPIAALADAAREVAAGNLAARAQVAGAAEIAEVASQFNRMLDERARVEAELRLANQRCALAASTGEVWYWDVAGGEIHFPESFWRRLGYDQPETANTLALFESLLHPEDLERWRQAVKEHIARRSPYELDFRARAGSGEYRWFHTRGQAVWDESGRATYMAGTTYDITERKQVQAQQKELEQRVVEILEGMSDGFVAFDRGWRYTYVNRAAAELFGRSADSLLGKIYDEEYPEAAGTPFERAYRRAMDERVPVTIEDYYPAWQRWFENRVFPTPGGISIFFSEITERKRAEAALRESEERFRQLAANVDEVFWLTDPAKNTMLYVSPAFEAIWGRSCESLYASPRDWLEAIHPADRARVLEAALTRQLAGTYEEEYRIVRPDGSERWIRDRAFPVRDTAGAVYRIAGVAQDITESKRAEGALRESEARLRNVLDNMFPFVGLLSLDGRVLEVNRPPLEAAGLTREAVIGQPCAEILWFSHSADVQERLRAALARAGAGAAARYDETIQVSGGRFITIDLMFSPLRDAEGRVSRIVGSATDITERRRAEEALRAANERLQALSARLLEVQEAERGAIARELHDEIGQSLTALKLGAQGLARRADAKAAESLARLVAIADRTLAQTRDLSLLLRPPQLDQLGLAATLRDTVSRIADAAGVEARLVVEPEDIALERSLATAAFRVAQEALTNAVRHAAARHLVVELRATHDRLLLAVGDDGRGFDLEAARSRAVDGASIGLLGMEERVALAGGTLEIVTRPGEGTRVEASFPLRPRSE